MEQLIDKFTKEQNCNTKEIKKELLNICKKLKKWNEERYSFFDEEQEISLEEKKWPVCPLCIHLAIFKHKISIKSVDKLHKDPKFWKACFIDHGKSIQFIRHDSDKKWHLFVSNVSNKKWHLPRALCSSQG